MFEAHHPLLLQGIVEWFELEETLKNAPFPLPWTGMLSTRSGWLEADPIWPWTVAMDSRSSSPPLIIVSQVLKPTTEARQWERWCHCAFQGQEPSGLGDEGNKALRHLHPKESRFLQEQGRSLISREAPKFRRKKYIFSNHYIP